MCLLALLASSFLSKEAQIEKWLCTVFLVNMHTLCAVLYCRALVRNPVLVQQHLQRQSLTELIACKYCMLFVNPQACFDLEPKWPLKWKLQIRQCPATPPLCLYLDMWVPGEVVVEKWSEATDVQRDDSGQSVMARSSLVALKCFTNIPLWFSLLYLKKAYYGVIHWHHIITS